MHENKHQIAPTIFQNKFRKPTHMYSTSPSTSNDNTPRFKLIKFEYRIAIGGPIFCKSIPTNSEKHKSVIAFKNSIKITF